jgi:nucleoside-diphosphate-sugar epimerase
MILVTGATGFVGAALVERLAREGVETRACVRRNDVFMPAGIHTVLVEDLTANTDWSLALTSVGVIVHTAARVHVMNDVTNDSLTEYRRTNVQGTLNLARQAVAAGVRRFVFISSIKVNGEATELGFPFSASDMPAPLDPYGVSKMEAEQGLREIGSQTGLEIVIIRPPLVYGFGVKANFAALMRIVQRKWVLPLSAVHNKRSLVALDNLVDLIVTCITHPKAAQNIFLVSDGHDLSTTELILGLAQAAGVSARLLPMPVWVLQAAATMIGKGDVAKRLCGNLQVDISKTQSLLDWKPAISVEEGLLKAVKGIQKK